MRLLSIWLIFSAVTSETRRPAARYAVKEPQSTDDMLQRSPRPQWIPPQITQLVETAPSGSKWLHESSSTVSEWQRGLNVAGKASDAPGVDWSAKYPTPLRRSRAHRRTPRISTASYVTSALPLIERKALLELILADIPGLQFTATKLATAS
jgi:hypothetical protein